MYYCLYSLFFPCESPWLQYILHVMLLNHLLMSSYFLLCLIGWLTYSKPPSLDIFNPSRSLLTPLTHLWFIFISPWYGSIHWSNIYWSTHPIPNHAAPAAAASDGCAWPAAPWGAPPWAPPRSLPWDGTGSGGWSWISSGNVYITTIIKVIVIITVILIWNDSIIAVYVYIYICNGNDNTYNMNMYIEILYIYT